MSNPNATYTWGLGSLERGNDDAIKFEVPSHQWFDLTDKSGQYGVSVLTQDKYGSDKPNDNTLRLTLLYTPGVNGGYQDQGTQDWGRHEILYALQGHTKDWRQAGQTPWAAARLNQPLIAFQTPSHTGSVGRTFSLLQTSTPQVSVDAVKQAEDGQDVIVRVNELTGQAASGVHLALAGPILSAREVNGQEQPLDSPTGAVAVQNGKLVFDMQPYRPRAFALHLGAAPARLSPPQSTPLPLPYNVNVLSSAPGATDGDFDGQHDAIPAELLPATIDSDGVTFHTASASAGQNNAVSCQSQTIALPTGKGRRVYLLAASAKGDVAATFQIDGHPVTRTIQSWDGFIGQWDSRVWGGDVPESTYDWHNPLVGLTPGYIKPATVAWYADHKRLARRAERHLRILLSLQIRSRHPRRGTDADAAQFPRCPYPGGHGESTNPNDDARPAQPLTDILDRSDSAAPEIVPSGGACSTTRRP